MEQIVEKLSQYDKKILNDDCCLLYPKKILFDKELERGAILLYIQIFAMTNYDFCCEIDNDKLAELCQSSVRSIQRWMASLVKKFYLTLKFERTEDNKIIRKILINVA